MSKFALINSEPMQTVQEEHVIWNGNICLSREVFREEKNAETAYEVLRVVNGKPLFFREHIGRLRNTLRLSDVNANVSIEKLKKSLLELIKIDGRKEGNVRIDFLFDNKELKGEHIYFVPHRYPSCEAYFNGIKVGAMHAERTQPNGKVVYDELRKEADRLIDEKGYYEVLLIDRLGMITEGSRSNVFFIKGDTVFTPPAHKLLEGITYQKVLAICKIVGIDVVEFDVDYTSIATYDAAFITGTSPKILPVREIEAHGYDVSHELIQQIAREYDKLIKEDLNAFSYR